MMKIITNILGAVLCLTALIGFFNNDFMKMDLSPLHCGFLLVMGAISLYFGTQGTEFQARNMCRTLGIMFALLGGITFFGNPGHATAGGVDIASDNVLKIIPGQLEYTTADGVRNLLLGLVGLIAGFFPREQEIEIDTKLDQARLKAEKAATQH